MSTSTPRADTKDPFVWILFGGLAIAWVAGVAGWIATAVLSVIAGVAVPEFSLSNGLLSWLSINDLESVWGEATYKPGWWLTIAVIACIIEALLIFVCWRVVRSITSTSRARTVKPESRAGIASRGEVKQVASPKAIVGRGSNLRPSLTKPRIKDLGFQWGTSHGVDVWSTVEDAVVVVGPTRSGKGLHVVVNAILDAPGAVVTTSTRPDNLTLTLTARQVVGPIAVFDPQRMVSGVESGVKWSPVRGCRDPQTAMIRARGFAASTGLGGGGVENGGFWQGQTESVIRAMLHAADLDGRDARDIYRWSIDATVCASEAVAILADHPSAAPGWGMTLAAAATSDQRTRDSIWMGVRQAFASLGDPQVLEAVLPRTHEQFDPEEFLTQNGTVYLLGTATGAEMLGGLVSAFMEDLIETARKIAARSPGARLDPPVSLVLDEIANFTGLPSLPALMSEGGGSGLTTFAIFQSLAQVRDKWGDHTANAIWDSAVVKLVLGGGSNSRDLSDLVTLIGDRDETTVSVSRGRTWADRNESASLRRVPIMDAAALRQLPFGTGLLLLRSSSPLVVTLRSYTDREDASELKAGRASLETKIRSAS